MSEIASFDTIWKCWNEKEFPNGFDDVLENYIELKRKIFCDMIVDINKQTVPNWLSKVLIAIEIGIERDAKRFDWHKNFWENLLGVKFAISIEDRRVAWQQ